METKRCPDCNEHRPLSEFGNNRSTKDGLTTYCQEHHRARGRACLERAGGSRKYHTRRRYGVDVEDVDALLDRQGGVCAICKYPVSVQDKTAHIDHDHKTGRVRGVLCFTCNIGVANFKEDPVRVRAAADYVEEAREGRRGIMPFKKGNTSDSWGWKSGQR